MATTRTKRAASKKKKKEEQEDVAAKNHKKTKLSVKWTREEIIKLIDLRENHDPKLTYDQIAEILGNNRTSTGVMQKYLKLPEKNKNDPGHKMIPEPKKTNSSSSSSSQAEEEEEEEEPDEEEEDEGEEEEGTVEEDETNHVQEPCPEAVHRGAQPPITDIHDPLEFLRRTSPTTSITDLISKCTLRFSKYELAAKIAHERRVSLLRYGVKEEDEEIQKLMREEHVALLWSKFVEFLNAY
jgi:hypothetical protein